MSKCWACGKPVYFAERRTSLGKDWHRQCLRCVHCKKVLQPGQHAEHNGLPYCEKPCYNVLFGPKIHGFRVSDHVLHSKFGNPNEWKSPVATLQRSDLIQKIRTYNQRQLACNRLEYSELNGRVLISGFLRVQWRVQEKLHLLDSGNHYQRNSNMFLPNSSTGSAFVPNGSITSVHATNEETVETVIENLFRKFSIKNDPQDFALVIAFPIHVLPNRHSLNDSNSSSSSPSNGRSESAKRSGESKHNGTGTGTSSTQFANVVLTADGATALRIVEKECPLVVVFELLLECIDDRQREEVTVFITDFYALAELLLVNNSQPPTPAPAPAPTPTSTPTPTPAPTPAPMSKTTSKLKSSEAKSRTKSLSSLQDDSAEVEKENGSAAVNELHERGLDGLSLNVLERILRCVNEQEQREFMQIRNKYKQCRMHLEIALNKSEILL